MVRRSVFALAVAVVACRPSEPAPPDPKPAAESKEKPRAPEEPPLRLVEVAPGVHAALQPRARRFRDCNAAVIVARDEVMLIDGPQRILATQWLTQQFELLDPARRLRLVTTHWHLDHSLAATFVADRRAADAPVDGHIGHVDLAGLLSAKGAGQLHEHKAGLADMTRGAEGILASGQHVDGSLTEAQRAEVEAFVAEARPEIEVLDTISELHAPTVSIAKPTETTVGKHVVELIPLQAHTDADLVVYLPESQVLIAGDVVDELPFAGHGHPYRWLLALEGLRERGVERIVPGHGDVLGPEHLDREIELLRVVVARACEAIAAGHAARASWEAWKVTPEVAGLRDVWVTDGTSERAFAAFVPEMLVRAVDEREGCDP